MQHNTYELKSYYSNRKSFYGKATVTEKIEDDKKVYVLTSFSTDVAKVTLTTDSRKAEVFGNYSNTTNRHIKEFLKQQGFFADKTKQILDDYYSETN